MSTRDETTFDGTFRTSFAVSRQERAYLERCLGDFFEDCVITEVTHRVKGGKEATVFGCRAHPALGGGLLAAKVYRPRMFRAMRNDSFYKQGRGMMDGEGKLVLDGRSLRALAKRTSYGKRLDSASWCMHEWSVLTELSEAGAEVPKPIAFSPSAILMEYVGDEAGPAPVLQDIALPRAEAEELFERVLRSVETMLSCFVVHADLSAYNVMLNAGEVRIIDFPQAVDALRHPQGFALLARDVDRLCRYFARQGVTRDAVGLATRLWHECVE